MFSFFEAFQKGKELSNAATWKNVQVATNALTVVITFSVGVAKFMFGVDYHITPDQISSLALGLATVVGTVCAINGVLTVVTSKKVGTGEGTNG